MHAVVSSPLRCAVMAIMRAILKTPTRWRRLSENPILQNRYPIMVKCLNIGKNIGKSIYRSISSCVSALGKGNLHFCDGTINAEKYIEILEHNMLPSRRHLFQGRPCIFQQDNAKPHSAHITKSWLRRKRVRVLDWPACSPDLSPIENVWHILKRKMRQRRPRTVAHLKTCLQEEWDKITPETLHHLVSSVPKRLLSVVKRNGNITKW